MRIRLVSALYEWTDQFSSTPRMTRSLTSAIAWHGYDSSLPQTICVVAHLMIRVVCPQCAQAFDFVKATRIALYL
jgi:hypothetical protein